MLIGAQGSGKGTQAQLLEDQLNLKACASGELLRDAIARGTPLGLAAKPYYDNGDLVPDDLVAGLVLERLKELGDASGIILDGFPRTIAQAEALDRLLAARGKTLDAVVEMQVDDDALVKRIAGRFTCAGCGEGYHDAFKTTKSPGVCDRCGSTQFVRRRDDTEEVVRSRLAAYHAQTEPLIDYYRHLGKLKTVDGMAEIGAVHRAIARALDGDKL